MPGLASQGRSEFKKQQEVRKSSLFFWLSKGTDTSEGVPADPAPDLGTLMHGVAVSSSLSIARDCFSLEALLSEKGKEKNPSFV